MHPLFHGMDHLYKKDEKVQDIREKSEGEEGCEDQPRTKKESKLFSWGTQNY